MAQRTAKEWFEEADKRFQIAVQRVMTAGTDPAGGLGAVRELDWTEFRREAERMYTAGQERHAAKHAAMREALFSTSPITIYRDGSHVAAVVLSAGETGLSEEEWVAIRHAASTLAIVHESDGKMRPWCGASMDRGDSVIRSPSEVTCPRCIELRRAAKKDGEKP